jgi:hypothetical protein
MNKTRYALKFSAVMVLLFVIIAVGLYFGGVLFTKTYPILSANDSLRDTVANVLSDGRGSARITSTSSRKFTLPWAKKFENGREVSLTRIVQEGDILIKREFSDTIILIHDERRYTFVAYKTIE